MCPTRLNIPDEEARDIIERYFKRYAGIKRYLEETVRVAKERGYVETLFGRRRPMADLRAKNRQVVQAAERAAINMPIQGTAADLIKKAKLAKGLPEVPNGGMWARFSPPRFAFVGGGTRGGFSVGAGSRAQVNVANGMVVLMGVSANTAASAAVTSARTSGACRDESDKGDAKAHHIATNKNDLSDVNGGPWTPLFKRLFDRAEMSLNDPANIVYLMGHVGPHPEAYHEEVFSRLRVALGDCKAPADCRNRLTHTLDKIAGEVCTSGSELNKLATRMP
ncbi:MAG TPA: DNA polymerase [Archangium sp.]|nr:DNA polymerase [Archangium sp.]